MAMMMAFMIISCRKPSDDPAPSSTDTFISSLAKKWNISGNNTSRTESTNNYQWFEFTSDYKYIVKTSDSLYFGDYTISDDRTTITLGTFAVITIKNLVDKNFSFSIKTAASASPLDLFSNVSESQISASRNTDLLCGGTWKFLRAEIPGKDTTYFDGSEKDSTKFQIDNGEVIFSKSGTYFINFTIKERRYTNGNTTTVISASTVNAVREWKWKDASETSIYFADSANVFHDDDYFTIVKLTDSEFNYSEILKESQDISYGFAVRKKK